VRFPPYPYALRGPLGSAASAWQPGLPQDCAVNWGRIALTRAKRAGKFSFHVERRMRSEVRLSSQRNTGSASRHDRVAELVRLRARGCWNEHAVEPPRSTAPEPGPDHHGLEVAKPGKVALSSTVKRSQCNGFGKITRKLNTPRGDGRLLDPIFTAKGDHYLDA
jgi:hypothetical protein